MFVSTFCIFFFLVKCLFWFWLQNMHVNPLSDKDKAAGYWISFFFYKSQTNK